MTHVSIDRQPEEVKHFFETLELTPEGSVVEMNGRPMARMLPAEATAADGDGEWTSAKNQRRGDLIDKKFEAGLTAGEELELASLTAGLRKFTDRVAPVPLDTVRRLHQKLVVKATQSNSGS